MITRKEFVKNCAVALCASSLCRSSQASEKNPADEQTGACKPEALTVLNQKLDAGHVRFAKLVEGIENKLDEADRKRLFNGLGRQCAATYGPSLIDRYKGNIRGFLEEGRRLWMAEAEFNEAEGTIRVIDKSPTCSCPLVKEGATPPSFCDCTLGWQEAAYSTILGKPVRAELEESILRGGKRCIYRIRVI